MSVETLTGTGECPDCFSAVELKEVMQNEIVQCPDCGAELEVMSLDPVKLEAAPEEEEDWGE